MKVLIITLTLLTSLSASANPNYVSQFPGVFQINNSQASMLTQPMGIQNQIFNQQQAMALGQQPMTHPSAKGCGLARAFQKAFFNRVIGPITRQQSFGF